MNAPAKLEDSEDQLRSLTLDEAISRSYGLLARVVGEVDETHELTAICVLYSGGNDSTVLAHLLRDVADYAVHINTGIGVEETREFVRQTCQDYKLPLIEEHPPPGATYDELVMRFGFPGPAGHQLMFSRLKERGLRAVRRRFVTKPRKQRIIFCAGMRVFESSRRWRNTEETHREGSIVWVSPIAHWTNEHIKEYRQRYECQLDHRHEDNKRCGDLPRNQVSDTLHMSGECLCGAFAKPNELEEIAFWYPQTAERIRALEARAREAGVHCVWGTRPPPKGRSMQEEKERQAALLVDSEAGLLCSACTTPEPDDVDAAIAEMTGDVTTPGTSA